MEGLNCKWQERRYILWRRGLTSEVVMMMDLFLQTTAMVLSTLVRMWASRAMQGQNRAI